MGSVWVGLGAQLSLVGFLDYPQSGAVNAATWALHGCGHVPVPSLYPAPASPLGHPEF